MSTVIVSIDFPCVWLSIKHCPSIWTWQTDFVFSLYYRFCFFLTISFFLFMYVNFYSAFTSRSLASFSPFYRSRPSLLIFFTLIISPLLISTQAHLIPNLICCQLLFWQLSLNKYSDVSSFFLPFPSALCLTFSQRQEGRQDFTWDSNVQLPKGLANMVAEKALLNSVIVNTVMIMGKEGMDNKYKY